MKARSPMSLALAWTLIVSPALTGQAPSGSQRPLELPDILAWKTIRVPTLSNDGAWFAYQLVPNEADAEVVVRSTTDTTEYRFPIGEPPRGFGSGPGSALAFSGTSAWVAFTTYPTAVQAKKLRADKKTPRNGVKIVSLADGSAVKFDEVRTFSFSGERGDWIALHRLAAEAPAGGSGP